MRLFLKILKLSAILIIIISALLVSASILLRERVAVVILNSINRNLSTKLDAGSFKLSFINKFPKASLELKNVLVHSSNQFNSREFDGINTDTLLAAKLVTAEFKITDIIKGNYNIESISAKNGKAFFYTDTSGHVNYNVSVKNGNAGNEVFTINLERINLNDLSVIYINRAIKLIIKGNINNAKLKSRISGDNIDFIAAAGMKVNHFELYNTTISRPVSTSLNLILQSSKSGIIFRKGTLSIENYQFALNGSVMSGNVLDLNVTGLNIDIAKIRKYLPEKYQKTISDYNPTGLLIADCKIKGSISRTSNPHVEINYVLKKGNISNGRSGPSINNLSFTGHFSNGVRNKYETCSATFNDIRVNLGRSAYTGSVAISGFIHPRTEIYLKGRAFPDELREFFNIKKISMAEGSVDLDLKLITDFWPKDSIKADEIIDLKPEGKLSFNSFSLNLPDYHFKVNNVNGNVYASEVLKAENLSFLYKGQNIKVDGNFRNLPEWLSGRQVVMSAVADVTMDRFIPEAFSGDTESGKTRQVTKTAVRFPGDLILDLNFKIDSLSYKTFFSSKIAGTLNYKHRLLTFKSLNMHSLKGTISGTGFVIQNTTKSVIAKGNFNLNNIDINEAFVTFHNFGQDFIKAENLSGNLSGSLSVLIPMDSMLNTQFKALTAEGRYVITSGALINFEPVKKLSSYIELSELENIHFARLENDFFIRNYSFYLPQMEVKSSAADLSVNGKHSFDNNYEYHVKMLLSEILSKKRRKNKTSNTEFGIVEDDGLGRTSMLLKVTGKGEDVKVGYDMKAAGNEVRESIKTERQTLKSILNQEYGWYKGDSTIVTKPAGKKTRFRINWDDSDSSKAAADTPEIKADRNKITKKVKKQF
jgi:hypothetical protein